MLNAQLFIDGAAFFAGTVGLSKTPFATSIQRPFNLSGFAISSATNAFAFAATSQRSEAEKAAALACTTLLLCLIAKPLAQRTTILLSPYAAIQLTAFHALLKVTLYGIYKLAKHFTVSVSFNPTTTEDIKKIAVSQLGTRKAELERSMEEKWDTFNLNMQAAFNVMLVENGQTALPFTNYTREALLSEKELQVFQDFVGDHAKNKEQSQVLFDHDLPPPKQFDALPDLSPTTADIPTLSSSQLLWYYQAFCKKLAPEAQVSPFTLAFYHADLLPPTNAFFTPLPIPSNADKVSVNQAHYFVNYDQHHPEAFDKQTEKEQAILNEIFVKAGKKPYSLKKPEEPPIESPSWSTAKKVMVYGGCALAIIALVAIPTALFLMGPTTPITPSQEDHSQREINKITSVFNDTIPLIEDQPLPLVNQSSVSLAEEPSPLPIYFPLPQEQLPEAHKIADVYDAPCFPEVPCPPTHEIFPQEKFKIDLSHLIPKPYELTPPDRAVSLLYPSLESRYAVCSPDEKPQQPLVPPPVTHEMFPQETFKIDLSHLMPKPYEPTPPDRAVSLLYPSLESRYAVPSPDEKPLSPTNHSLTPIDLNTFQPHEELSRPYVHELPQLPNHLNFVHQTITSPYSLPQANPASYSWKYLSLLAVPIGAVIAGITKIASCLLRKPPRKKESRQLVSSSKTPPGDSSAPLHLELKPISAKIIAQPTIDFGSELYLELMREHEMRPAFEVDNTLWETDFHNLPRAFEKLSHYTIQTLTGVEDGESELSTIGKKFSKEDLDRIAKLVAKVTAEKAKVSWNAIESFSFDFYKLGNNFTCVMVRVQLKEVACERLRLPVNLFTDVHYTYPPRSKHKKEEPLLFDKSIDLSLAEELSLQDNLQDFLTKLSKVTIQCESWTSQESWALQNEELERLPYDLSSLLKINQSDKVEDGSWRQACTVVQALARKVAEEKLRVTFEEIDSYDLQILKNKHMISFIVTVTLNDEKAADARTFFSLKQLKKAASNL